MNHILPEPEVPALELINLTRQRPGTPPVFSQLNLSVPSSGITVLLGPSGCGKSTLLRCAASLESCECGTIRFFGRPVHRPSIQRQLILQDDNQLFPWLTVAENTAFPRKRTSAGRSPDGDGGKARHSVEELLDMVNLREAARLYPAQLSGGMKQRAVLARALSAAPSLLLLDEPFAALDSHIRSRLQQLLIRIHQEEGTAMLLVTHSISEALILGDFIICMNALGVLSQREPNPLGNSRNPEKSEFHQAATALEKRYALLVNPVNP